MTVDTFENRLPILQRPKPRETVSPVSPVAVRLYQAYQPLLLSGRGFGPVFDGAIFDLLLVSPPSGKGNRILVEGLRTIEQLKDQPEKALLEIIAEQRKQLATPEHRLETLITFVEQRFSRSDAMPLTKADLELLEDDYFRLTEEEQRELTNESKEIYSNYLAWVKMRHKEAGTKMPPSTTAGPAHSVLRQIPLQQEINRVVQRGRIITNKWLSTTDNLKERVNFDEIKVRIQEIKRIVRQKAQEIAQRQEKHPMQERRKKTRILTTGYVVAAIGLTSILASQAGILSWYLQTKPLLPSVAGMKETAATQQTVVIADNQGQQIFEFADPDLGVKKYIPFTNISQSLMDEALVAVEDNTFWTNQGYDVRSNASAVYNLLKNTLLEVIGFDKTDYRGGASTITQQLARNLLFGPEFRSSENDFFDTMDRKAREILLASEITKKYSKEEIMEMYLNTAYYGNLAWGIEAAAQTYFGLQAKNLTPAQVTFLVGLPQAPATYDPWTNPQAAFDRQREVLELLERRNVITKKQRVSIEEEMVNMKFIKKNSSSKFNYFAEMTNLQLGSLYEDDFIRNNGLKVQTTADSVLQDKLDEENHSGALASAMIFNGTNGKLLAISGNSSPFKVIIPMGMEEATLSDLAFAYSLAHGGVAVDPVIIEKIVDMNGDLLCVNPAFSSEIPLCPEIEGAGVQFDFSNHDENNSIFIGEVMVNGNLYTLAFDKVGDNIIAMLSTQDKFAAVSVIKKLVTEISKANTNQPPQGSRSPHVRPSLMPYSNVEYRFNPASGWQEPYDSNTGRFISPQQLAETLALQITASSGPSISNSVNASVQIPDRGELARLRETPRSQRQDRTSQRANLTTQERRARVIKRG